MTAARSHLAAIAAAPRPSGGEAERTAREYCAAVLRGVGFDVSERTFELSTFPGKWGTPLFGVGVAAVTIAAAREGAMGSGARALRILIAGAAVLAVSGRWLGTRGVLDLPFARARSSNLVATRGAPSLWLVAHLDSKSQPIPIVVRALAIMASLIFFGVAAGVAVAQLVVPMPPVVWFALASIVLVASLPVMASMVGTRSPGALDNASGVATVLRAAELLPRDIEIGVLLTGAEELGLAGARAWAREQNKNSETFVAPSSAINVDGVDDTGEVRLIYSGNVPRALLTLLGVGWPKPVRLVPGVLMDGVALADAGWVVLNVSKGSWRTVRRIHTASDDLAHLQGTGAEELAARLAGAIEAGRH
ncbi:MAG: M28 family metallopeptidase [Gemmatimonadota bacterium]|nr:M28 family metallopeptidase [Gemmatimonadota bacterium]